MGGISQASKSMVLVKARIRVRTGNDVTLQKTEQTEVMVTEKRKNRRFK